MTSDDVPPLTRRSLRATASSDAVGVPDAGDGIDAVTTLLAEPAAAALDTRILDTMTDADVAPAPTPEPAPTRPGGRIALAWLDDAAFAAAVRPLTGLDAVESPVAPASADLLATAPRRSPFRPGVIIPILLIAALFGGYAATTLLWPLHAVAPTITAVQVEPVAAPVAAPAWPAQGSAAIAVRGIPGTLSSTADPAPIASITKVLTALLVLEEMPLAVGEQGPEFRFTGNDRTQYWAYRGRGESALNVPVGGSLTEYQMLQGMLIGSANNYADRLAGNLWPSNAVFAKAANEWLTSHGVPGITVYSPTGFDSRNVATNEALVNLAVKALANPVIAEIVATKAVDLPGAGHVENTNDLLADPGVVGIKTGSLDEFNLLSAKDVTVAGVTVRLYASVLGQPDPETRSAASRALYAQLEAELQPKPSVVKGTTAGVVETRWGDTANVVTTEDASIILWNGGVGTVAVQYALDDSRDAGDAVGSLTVTGPLDAKTVTLALDGDIEPPSAWWRLTHPLDLFGLTS
ncbi:D-alanyl-D-alanine carboxypeptidase [Microbacterium ulmi]|uniref:D-alanyl-D-alanine carboxypeptidase n=1 Tax=Microbacterium ulmi TaxID=179095 RepID=A0A7Y2M272_9MICO|nr:D-alanyl-D-alanine carboxypeptidase (penicillin-binding protein 5/6) [Microbacterium ulmi]NNH05151.1 D-alanyl-D-alanine carboxypeptidase [Microbacterium ulmi]